MTCWYTAVHASPKSGGTVYSISSWMCMGVVNAHILEMESPHCPKRSQKELRVELAREMMALHSSRKKRAQNSLDSVPPSRCFCGKHFPAVLPAVLDCRYCSNRASRKRTEYCCKDCSEEEPIPLCVVPCFRLYHTSSRT